MLKKHFRTICSREVNHFGDLVKEADNNKRKDTKWTVFLSHDKNYPKALSKHVELTDDTLEAFLEACASSPNKAAGIRFDMTNPNARKVNQEKVCFPSFSFFSHFDRPLFPFLRD